MAIKKKKSVKTITKKVTRKPLKKMVSPVAEVTPALKRNISRKGNILVDKIILPQCIVLFSNEEDTLNLFVSASNIYENTLKDYLKFHNPKLTLDRKTLNGLIENVKGFKGFPQKFISGFYRVKWRGNKQRHFYLDNVTEIDLIILRLEVYSYLKWFFETHLKQRPIEVMRLWHNQFITPNKANSEIYRLNKVISDYEVKFSSFKSARVLNISTNTSSEIQKLEGTINHYKQTIESYKDRENELTKEIIKLKSENKTS